MQNMQIMHESDRPLYENHNIRIDVCICSNIFRRNYDIVLVDAL